MGLYASPHILNSPTSLNSLSTPASVAANYDNRRDDEGFTNGNNSNTVSSPLNAPHSRPIYFLPIWSPITREKHLHSTNARPSVDGPPRSTTKYFIDCVTTPFKCRFSWRYACQWWRESGRRSFCGYQKFNADGNGDFKMMILEDNRSGES